MSFEYHGCFSEGDLVKDALFSCCEELLLLPKLSSRPEVCFRDSGVRREAPSKLCSVLMLRWSVYAVPLDPSPSSNPVSRKMDLRFLLMLFNMEKEGSRPDPSRSLSSVLCELNLGRTGGAKLGS